MGEVRKRKNSGEAKNGTSAAPAAAPAKSGGLGLIPVVLISALLAGSGCHVIRKDTAKSIADLKMEEILLELAKTESASADRAKKITDLEQQLSTSHADAASKLDALNAVIDTLPQEIQKDLAKQGGEIESVSSKLTQLEAKVTEQNAQIESNSAAAGDKEELEGVSAKLASLATQVDSARADLVQLSSKMPSQVTMEKMSIQSEKAVEGLETANGLLDKHAKEINALKQAGEKELGNLDAKVTELNDSSTDAAKKSRLPRGIYQKHQTPSRCPGR